MSVRFFECDICHNMIEMVNSSGVNIVCCNQDMTELKPNSVDADLEKHVPHYEKGGSVFKVKVGETMHPKTEDHHIMWVVLETNRGVYRKDIPVGDDPVVDFILLNGEEPLNVYAYCNIHGLWVREVK